MEGLDFSNLTAYTAILVAFGALLRWALVTFSNQQRESAESTRTAIRQSAKSQLVLAATLLAFQRQLLLHDVTVTGVNPSAGATADERTATAIEKIRQVELILDEQDKKINHALEGFHK